MGRPDLRQSPTVINTTPLLFAYPNGFDFVVRLINFADPGI
jgi:hypothetical protein